MIAVGWIVSTSFAAGVVAAGTVGWFTTWAADTRYEMERAKVIRLEADDTAAVIEANAKARAAQLLVDALSTDLAHSRKQRETVVVTVVKRIPQVASPTHVALRNPAVRVLNDGKADAAAVRRDYPGRAGAPVPAPSPYPNGSTSELAMTNWAWDADSDYNELLDTYTRLAAAVASAPCIKITR